MTDKQFKKLEEKIEDKMEELELLQAKYHHETGVDFVRPLRLAPRKGK
jgi:hypothetical protein